MRICLSEAGVAALPYDEDALPRSWPSGTHATNAIRRSRLQCMLPSESIPYQLRENGFLIYAGQGDLVQTLFRIPTMGNVSPADMKRLLTCFARLA